MISDGGVRGASGHAMSRMVESDIVGGTEIVVVRVRQAKAEGFVKGRR